MALLPSLRQKKRYIVFKIDVPQQFTFEDVKEEVEKSLLRYLGEFGVAKAAPMLVKEKYAANTFTLKVGHKYVDEAKAAVILIKKIKNSPILIRSKITSGTLKKASTYI